MCCRFLLLLVFRSLQALHCRQRTFKFGFQTLPALNRRVPRLSVATNCHGRTQFLPCWLCSCGRKLVHLEDHLFSAAVFDHGAPEGLVADVPVVDTFVSLFTTFLCKLMCSVVLFASGSFSIPVTNVVCLFGCKKRGMENESRVDEMYFRFSDESVVIKRPHTQYITPGLQ